MSLRAGLLLMVLVYIAVSRAGRGENPFPTGETWVGGVFWVILFAAVFVDLLVQAAKRR